MLPTSSTTPEEERRLAETVRKRRYRAGKRNELIQLKAEVRRLASYLGLLKTKRRIGRLEQLAAENSNLRAKVDEYQYLVIMLPHWVYMNEKPQKDLSPQPAYTTLLATPITRKQGLQWLSERVYHEACLVLPTSPFQGHAEDAITLDIHVSDDIDEEGPTIAAIETRFQHTVCTNFESAARFSWKNMTGAVLPVSRTLIENVDNRFMYFHHTNSRLGTNALTIAAQFKEANRVVLVNCFIAKDELFPLGDGLQRPHGFSWTVYQAVTPDITLVYNRAFQYTPLSTNGRQISLERVGQLFGLSPQGVRHRTTFIEQIRSAAEAAFVETTRITIRHVTAGMETTSTFVEPSSE
ncbi:hypothetical protein LEN26_002453 [Aphanomyces euteiches]|nr:hypothetical protein LEN26_015688 [Aphanomyces euteiches]KAH9159206.1 hypothetical protein LEN26_002453 [Aphanomyces euteiches]